jgi:hypothetical protein
MDIIPATWKKYRSNTPALSQFLDVFIIFAGVMTVTVFCYGIVFSTYPYQSFISAIFACAGPLFFTVNLRIQISKPKDFSDISPELALLSYAACNALLFFVLSSFLG